ncbi:hypothetical protein [Paludibacterium sp.]|uniref:hypothetical protein n=1 Tax=Paludibacterium sp. TaxID=1917523 RepID=UPI0025D42D6E|nr:hypothetical protein [Paludibacterium sp.]MBV8648473.1 hypothetical protein [Paludibacterium sp.]
MTKSVMIMSKQEIAKRLSELELGRGVRPAEGEGLTISALKQFLHYNNYRIYQATVGLMSQETQLRLSQFFNQYDAGEIVFTFRKGDGWRIHRPMYPVPRGEIKKPQMQVNMINGSIEYTLGDE